MSLVPAGLRGIKDVLVILFTCYTEFVLMQDNSYSVVYSKTIQLHMSFNCLCKYVSLSGFLLFVNLSYIPVNILIRYWFYTVLFTTDLT